MRNHHAICSPFTCELKPRLFLSNKNNGGHTAQTASVLQCRFFFSCCTLPTQVQVYTYSRCLWCSVCGIPRLLECFKGLAQRFTWKTCVPLAVVSKTIACNLHLLAHKQTLRCKKKKKKGQRLCCMEIDLGGKKRKNSSNACWEIHYLVRVALLKRWSVWVTSPQLLNLPTFPNCDETLAVTYGAKIQSHLSADCNAP